MPRQRARSTSPEVRDRNTRDILGRPGLAGMVRTGGRSVGRGRGQQSVVQNPLPESTPGAAGQGHLLILTATADSIASGGDYVTFGAEVHRRGFDEADIADGQTVIWPADTTGSIQVELAWDSYTGGGTVEIEVDGSVPGWGVVGSGSSGSEGSKRRGVDIAAGAAVKIKITQTSGSAQTADVTVEFKVDGPTSIPSSEYRQAVVDDGPLAYWRLGESSGTTAADETGNGYTGTYIGTFTLGAEGVMSDGFRNAALGLSAVTSSGVAGSDWADLEFAGAAPFSIECWFNADTLPSRPIILVQKQGTSGADTVGWELIVQGGASAYLQFSGGTTGHGGATAAGSVTAGADHHAVVTFDGTTLLLYLDGSLAATGTAGSLVGSTATLSIGYDSVDAGFEFDGRIDEVAVYGRALTAAEIVEHYTIGTQR